MPSSSVSLGLPAVILGLTRNPVDGQIMWKACVKAVYGSVQNQPLAHNLYALMSRLFGSSTTIHYSSPHIPTVLQPALSTQNSLHLPLFGRDLSTLPTDPIIKTICIYK